VEETRRARTAGLDLDHAVAMVVERTKARYAAFGPDADPALAVKFERISGSASNVSGIMHWLDQTEAAKPDDLGAHSQRCLRSCELGLRTGRQQEIADLLPGPRRGLVGGEGLGAWSRSSCAWSNPRGLHRSASSG
jgi:hypothetical protein